MLKFPKKKKEIYFDHAATTYTDEKVVKKMQTYFTKEYGNPSSLYNKGRITKKAISDSKKTIANLLHTEPTNIIFTSGGTESDNLAIFGIAHAHQLKGKHIITSVIEHHAVSEPLERLKKEGFDITLLKVDKNGLVDVKELVSKIRPDTILISIMHANNEIGTIEPIEEIGRELLKLRKKNKTEFPYFHTDACQSAGYLDLDVEKMHVDLLTLNGSKIYGPKGVGILYIRRGVKIEPLMFGGDQEKKIRPGTENIPAIVGLAHAFELVQKNLEKEAIRLTRLSKYMWKEIEKQIPKVLLNGLSIGDKNRLVNNVNVIFPDIEGEALILYLDEYGIMCSTGSACTSSSLEPSHVLLAIGLPYEYAHGSIRFSLGHCNSKADIDYMMKYLPEIVEKLREMSPTNLGMTKHPKYKK